MPARASASSRCIRRAFAGESSWRGRPRDFLFGATGSPAPIIRSAMSGNHNDRVGVDTDLRKLRRSAGFSQQQVAERAGCSIAAVALYERGYAPVNSTVLPRIIAVLSNEGPVIEPGARDASPTREARQDVSD